jgi:hypothetical protein
LNDKKDLLGNIVKDYFVNNEIVKNLEEIKEEND